MEMPTIAFTAPATVFDFRRSDDGEVVEDLGLLQTLDGLAYTDEEFSDYLADDDRTRGLAALGVTGGDLTFHFSGTGLEACTIYSTPRALNAVELGALCEYTIGQWSDGIGSNFFQERLAEGLAPQVLLPDSRMVRAEQFA